MIGRLVDGRYRVRARIARGGMATVYLATDLRLERRVALKVMHAHLGDDAMFQSRFIQEARAAGIEEFCFVTGRGKAVIEDHFDIAYELDQIGRAHV